jgi:hypothetical protein
MPNEMITQDGGTGGGLITGAGQLQYGDMLMGAGTAAGWRELAGWRDLPDADVADSPRPQAHGSYAGSVWGGSIAVTYTYLLRGTPEQKRAALNIIEQYAPMDGVDRPLAVDDGDGAWFRMARVTARTIPQDKHFNHAPLECSIQFLCADPRRYAIAERVANVTLPTSTGGLVYPLVYPLDYGTSTSGSTVAINSGSTPTPLVAVFFGPLDRPGIVTTDWRMAFDVTLVDGETLTVDTNAGTVLLNGNADRLYTLLSSSNPLPMCLLKPGRTNLSLTTESGSGWAQVTYRDARM